MFVEKAYAAATGWDFAVMAQNVQNAQNTSVGDFMLDLIIWLFGMIVMIIVLRFTMTICLRILLGCERGTIPLLESDFAHRWCDSMDAKIEAEEARKKAVEEKIENVSVKPVVATAAGTDRIGTVEVVPVSVVRSSRCPDFELDKVIADAIASVDMSGFENYKD